MPDRRASSRSQPTAAALRSAVRPVLRAVAARPGSLYQPVFLGPIDSVDIIEADVQSLAEAAGVPAYFGYGDEVARVLGAGSPALLVLYPEALSRYLKDGHKPSGRQQLILWSSSPFKELPSEIQEAAKGGLILDPASLVRPESGEWSMGPTIARCARDPGGLYNPVVLVAPRSQLAFIADEAALRLEAAGVAPVLRLSGTVRPDEPAVSRLTPGGALVLRSPDMPEESVLATFDRLHEKGVQVVLTLADAALDTLKNDADWAPTLGRGVTLIVSGPTATAAESSASSISGPDLPTLLTGGPQIGSDPERIMTGSLSSFPLPELIQTFGASRHTGRLIVFIHDRLGAIDFHLGRVVHAQHLEDRRRAEDLAALRPEADPAALGVAILHQRASDMGRWEDASFTFCSGRFPGMAEEDEMALAVDGLAMEIARRADEMPRRIHRTGGLGAVWEARSGVSDSGELGTDAQAVLQALDGEQTTAELAISLGLLPDEALQAIEALIDADLIDRVQSRPFAEGVPVHEVAETLLRWGLVPEAGRVFAAAESEGSLTPRGHALMGHLLAGTDPQGATSAFRAAADAMEASADRQAFFDNSVNALLLEVRGRQKTPKEGWSELRALLSGGFRDLARTVRHYGVVAELALRAGESSLAGTAISTLRASGGEEGRALAAALEPES